MTAGAEGHLGGPPVGTSTPAGRRGAHPTAVAVPADAAVTGELAREEAGGVALQPPGLGLQSPSQVQPPGSNVTSELWTTCQQEG